MDATEWAAMIIFNLVIVAVSVIAHMWVAYTRAPKLAVKGVKAWLQGEEGLQTLVNWFKKAISLKIGPKGETIPESLGKAAVESALAWTRSAEGKAYLSATVKEMLKEVQTYLDSEEGVVTLESVGSRTVDAAVGWLDTPEGRETVSRLMKPILEEGAKVAASGVQAAIGGYLGNAGKALASVGADIAAESNPIVAALMESPGGKKIYKKYGPLIDAFIEKRLKDLGSLGGSSGGSSPYGA